MSDDQDVNALLEFYNVSAEEAVVETTPAAPSVVPSQTTRPTPSSGLYSNVRSRTLTEADRLSFDNSQFDVNLYTQRLLATQSVEGLLKEQKQLSDHRSNLDHSKRDLVCVNFDQFKKAAELVRDNEPTISALKTRVGELTTQLDALTTTTTTLQQNITEKRDRMQQLSASRRRLERMGVLFGLPSRLKLCVRRELYRRAIQEYVDGYEVLVRFKHIPSFAAVLRESSAVMESLGPQLKAKLRPGRQPPLTPQEQMETAGLALHLLAIQHDRQSASGDSSTTTTTTSTSTTTTDQSVNRQEVLDLIGHVLTSRRERLQKELDRALQVYAQKMRLWLSQRQTTSENSDKTAPSADADAQSPGGSPRISTTPSRVGKRTLLISVISRYFIVPFVEFIKEFCLQFLGTTNQRVLKPYRRSAYDLLLEFTSGMLRPVLALLEHDIIRTARNHEDSPYTTGKPTKHGVGGGQGGLEPSTLPFAQFTCVRERVTYLVTSNVHLFRGMHACARAIKQAGTNVDVSSANKSSGEHKSQKPSAEAASTDNSAYGTNLAETARSLIARAVSVCVDSVNLHYQEQLRCVLLTHLRSRAHVGNLVGQLVVNNDDCLSETTSENHSDKPQPHSKVITQVYSLVNEALVTLQPLLRPRLFGNDTVLSFRQKAESVCYELCRFFSEVALLDVVRCRGVDKILKPQASCVSEQLSCDNPLGFLVMSVTCGNVLHVNHLSAPLLDALIVRLYDGYYSKQMKRPVEATACLVPSDPSESEQKSPQPQPQQSTNSGKDRLFGKRGVSSVNSGGSQFSNAHSQAFLEHMKEKWSGLYECFDANAYTLCIQWAERHARQLVGALNGSLSGSEYAARMVAYLHCMYLEMVSVVPSKCLDRSLRALSSSFGADSYPIAGNAKVESKEDGEETDIFGNGDDGRLTTTTTTTNNTNTNTDTNTDTNTSDDAESNDNLSTDTSNAPFAGAASGFALEQKDPVLLTSRPLSMTTAAIGKVTVSFFDVITAHCGRELADGQTSRLPGQLMLVTVTFALKGWAQMLRDRIFDRSECEALLLATCVLTEVLPKLFVSLSSVQRAQLNKMLEETQSVCRERYVAAEGGSSALVVIRASQVRDVLKKFPKWCSM